VTAGERATAPAAPGEFGDLGRALETMRNRLEGKQYVEQYVHALTHELKSPLAAIRGSAELVEAGGDAMPPADRQRFLATVRAQADRMAEMVDKMLALAAVEHRQRIDEPQPVDLARIAAEAIDRLLPKTQQRGLVVTLQAVPAIVRGDAFLLRQALVNLLDNAADFAPAGSAIDVRIERHDSRWHVTVADRGPGVPDFALSHAFERFYSLPRPGQGSRSSGLGLCFVAEVAALHAGEAALANREDGGAVATVSLPA
jgi:two-component system sensor histidine kinase CreC